MARHEHTKQQKFLPPARPTSHHMPPFSKCPFGSTSQILFPHRSSCQEKVDDASRVSPVRISPLLAATVIGRIVWRYVDDLRRAHVRFTVARILLHCCKDFPSLFHIRSRKLPNSKWDARVRLWSFTCYEERNDIYPSLSPLSPAWFVLEISFLLISLQNVLILNCSKKKATLHEHINKKKSLLFCLCDTRNKNKKETITKKRCMCVYFSPPSLPCPPFCLLFLPPLLLCNFFRKRAEKPAKKVLEYAHEGVMFRSSDFRAPT